MCHINLYYVNDIVPVLSILEYLKLLFPFTNVFKWVGAVAVPTTKS